MFFMRKKSIHTVQVLALPILIRGLVQAKHCIIRLVEEQPLQFTITYMWNGLPTIRIGQNVRIIPVSILNIGMTSSLAPYLKTQDMCGSASPREVHLLNTLKTSVLHVRHILKLLLIRRRWARLTQMRPKLPHLRLIIVVSMVKI